MLQGKYLERILYSRIRTWEYKLIDMMKKFYTNRIVRRMTVLLMTAAMFAGSAVISFAASPLQGMADVFSMLTDDSFASRQTSSASGSQSKSSVRVQSVQTKAAQADKMSDAEFNKYLIDQGFPASYRKSLRKLHKKHPNWVFIGLDTRRKWKYVVKKETKSGESLVHKSYPVSYRSVDKNGKYKECEPGWYNAAAEVVEYYLDPRNFLYEDSIYMFEDLSYCPEYQTKSVVSKILKPSKLPKYGFTAGIFVKAGKKYNISPVFLAARARQETGGGSICIDGSKGVYNPFNIGAYGSDPASQGIKYARKKGWTTQSKAVNGSADILADGYISKKQNTIYLQRFNVANGYFQTGTHQYMTNIMAPYSEAHITRNSYESYGITDEAITFLIPIYKNMPDKTSLPQKSN